MEERNSKYYNLNAQEAMKKFLKRYYIRKSITVFILVVLLCFLLLQGITFEYELFRWGVVITCMIAALAIFLLYIFLQSIDAKLLQMVLFMDCDPVKMLNIITLWEKRDKMGKAKHTFLLLKAQCCRFIPGRLEEGLAYLQQVNFMKKYLDREANRLLLFAQYSKIRGDRESFDKVKSEMEQLPDVYSGNKFRRKSWERTMRLLELEELLWDGKTGEARNRINTLLEQAPNQIGKVRLHMLLAQLDMEAEEYANAKRHLNYVIAYGNQLSIVGEAKECLESINQL